MSYSGKNRTQQGRKGRSVSQMEGTVCSLQRQRGVEECIPLLTLPDPRPGLQSVSSSCWGSCHGSLLLRPSDAPLDPETPGRTPKHGIGAPLIPMCQALPLSVSTHSSLMSPSRVWPLGSPRPSMVVAPLVLGLSCLVQLKMPVYAS